jgi:hypothetical protein
MPVFPATDHRAGRRQNEHKDPPIHPIPSLCNRPAARSPIGPPAHGTSEAPSPAPLRRAHSHARARPREQWSEKGVGRGCRGVAADGWDGRGTERWAATLLGCVGVRGRGECWGWLQWWCFIAALFSVRGPFFPRRVARGREVADLF